MASSDKHHNDEDVKNAFEAFGQRFLAEFAQLPAGKTSKGKRKRKLKAEADTNVRSERKKKRKLEETVSDDESDEGEHWEGVMDPIANVEGMGGDLSVYHILTSCRRLEL
jgi:hypothetical protein